ncbi:hypothetical protein FOZ62_014419, partial [Perkinsus olseni]
RKRAVRGRASSPRRPEVEVVGDQPQRGTVQQEASESVPLPLRSRSMSAPRIGPQRTSFATPARLRPSGSLIFPFSSTPRRVVGQRAQVHADSAPSHSYFGNLPGLSSLPISRTLSFSEPYWTPKM